MPFVVVDLIAGGGVLGLRFWSQSADHKPVYQGEFQIVLDQGGSKSVLAPLYLRTLLAAIAGLGVYGGRLDRY